MSRVLVKNDTFLFVFGSSGNSRVSPFSAEFGMCHETFRNCLRMWLVRIRVCSNQRVIFLSFREDSDEAILCLVKAGSTSGVGASISLNS